MTRTVRRAEATARFRTTRILVCIVAFFAFGCDSNRSMETRQLVEPSPPPSRAQHESIPRNECFAGDKHCCTRDAFDMAADMLLFGDDSDPRLSVVSASLESVDGLPDSLETLRDVTATFAVAEVLYADSAVSDEVRVSLPSDYVEWLDSGESRGLARRRSTAAEDDLEDIQIDSDCEVLSDFARHRGGVFRIGERYLLALRNATGDDAQFSIPRGWFIFWGSEMVDVQLALDIVVRCFAWPEVNRAAPLYRRVGLCTTMGRALMDGAAKSRYSEGPVVQRNRLRWDRLSARQDVRSWPEAWGQP